MNELDLRDLLPAERQLSAGRRREMKERLVQQIEEEERTARRRYRLLVGAVAAAVLAIAGAVAVYAGLSRDEPTEISPVVPGPETEDGAPATDWQQVARNFGGEAPVLDADRVACVSPAHGGPINQWDGRNAVVEVRPGEALTEQLLVDTCVSGNWAEEQFGQTDAFDLAGARLCVRETTEDPRQSPMPVVVLSGLTCEEVGEGVSVRPATEADVTELNRMRAIELGVLANPDPCPTFEDAKAWAETRLAEAGIEVEATEWPSDAPLIGCPYQPDVRWQGVGVAPGEDPMAVVVWISPPQYHGRSDS